jgi:hypothetical protein
VDSYAKELMIALTSNKVERAVKEKLLSFDLENWTIFTNNYYRLNPYEIEQIFAVFQKHQDFHLLIDFISIAHVIGSSILLSQQLISLFSRKEIVPVLTEVKDKVSQLLNSSLAEERRVGILLIGQFRLTRFAPDLFTLSDFDILFQDAYDALGRLNDSEINKKLRTKFLYLTKNLVQRKALAKVLAQKGNSLAALWLIKQKGLDYRTSITDGINFSRELLYEGVRPHFFLSHKDEFLREISWKMLSYLIRSLPYDYSQIKLLNLKLVVKKIIQNSQKFLSLEYVKINLFMKSIIEDLYYTIDPYSIDKEIRNQIIDSWNLISSYPEENTLAQIKLTIDHNLTLTSNSFLTNLQLIAMLNFTDFESRLLDLLSSANLSHEKEIALINTLGEIGSNKSAKALSKRLRTQIHPISTNLSSEIDYPQTDSFNQANLFEDENNFWLKTITIETLRSLSMIAANDYITILTNALASNDPRIQLAVIIGLQNQDYLHHQLEDELISIALHSPYISLQREAIITLGETNSEAVVPLLLNIVFEAIGDGTLEFTNTLEEEYDSRWENPIYEEIEKEKYHKDSSDQEVLNEVNIDDELLDSNQRVEDFLDEDIRRWLRRQRKTSNRLLELYEDFNVPHLELPFVDDFIDELPFLTINDATFLLEQEMSESNDWPYEIENHFKKLILVESSLEALKTTKAKIPLDEVKELLEQPVDEELYKDALIILAKSGEQFAIKELIGLFDEKDFLRSREIIEIIKQENEKEIKTIRRKIKQSPDWILQKIIKISKK